MVLHEHKLYPSVVNLIIGSILPKKTKNITHVIAATVMAGTRHYTPHVDHASREN